LGRTGHKFYINGDKGSAEVVSILCGIGKVNATAAAMHLVDIGCNIILNFGLSGGISGVIRGDLCLCNRFLEHDFDLTGIGYKKCEKPGQEYIYAANEQLVDLLANEFKTDKIGTAVSGDCFVSNDTLRSFLKDEFSAMSCDMESAAIAYVCKMYCIKFACVRKISDDAGVEAGDSYRQINALAEDVLINGILSIIAKIA
jgi:adenosylhomocysteine nucleosidase